ncbi:MAG: hypothetical protein AAF704_09935 [Cyanobacteria bacterium P01_D01_bin.123]
MSTDIESLKERIVQIRQRRPAVAKLLDRPNLGTLRVDVNQALEEIDDLLDEFDRAFPTDVTGSFGEASSGDT